MIKFLIKFGLSKKKRSIYLLVVLIIVATSVDELEQIQELCQYVVSYNQSKE